MNKIIILVVNGIGRLDELKEFSVFKIYSHSEVGDVLDLSDLEEIIDNIALTTEDFNNQFSPDFIEFSKNISEKVKSQVNEEASDDYLQKLAKCLANYKD
jgi:hypothetical protein